MLVNVVNWQLKSQPANKKSNFIYQWKDMSPTYLLGNQINFKGLSDEKSEPY